MDKKKIPGAMYGDYVIIPTAQLTDEVLNQAKEELLEQMLQSIRQLSEEHDDFFIIKKMPDLDAISIGWKIHFPTINIIS